jgi:hypothetical protein
VKGRESPQASHRRFQHDGASKALTDSEVSARSASSMANSSRRAHVCSPLVSSSEPNRYLAKIHLEVTRESQLGTTPYLGVLNNPPHKWVGISMDG